MINGIGGKLVLAFVTLILGVVLIGTIASNALTVTDKTVIIDENFDYTSKMVSGTVNVSANNGTVTNAPTGWKNQDCPLTNVIITNGSGTSTFTLNTDYQLDAATGTIAILNTTKTSGTGNVGNTSLIDYTYCRDDYMNLTWGRTLINLVAGFFAIAILLVSLGLFYSVSKDAGII